MSLRIVGLHFFIVYMNHSFFIQSSVDRLLGCFHILALGNIFKGRFEEPGIIEKEALMVK